LGGGFEEQAGMPVSRTRSIAEGEEGVRAFTLDEDGGADGDFLGDWISMGRVDPFAFVVEKVGGEMAIGAIGDPDLVCIHDMIAFQEVVFQAEFLQAATGWKGGGDEIEARLDDRTGEAWLGFAGIG